MRRLRELQIPRPPAFATAVLLVTFLFGALSSGIIVRRVDADAFTRFVRYGEKKTAVSVSTNAFTIDLSKGTHFVVSLTANVTSITFSNTLADSNYAQNFTIALTQDATGSRTVTGWPAAVKWVSGSAPTATTTATKTDLVSCLTYDGYTTDWCLYNQNF